MSDDTQNETLRNKLHRPSDRKFFKKIIPERSKTWPEKNFGNLQIEICWLLSVCEF